MIAAPILAAASALSTPATVLECSLVTPGGHPVTFGAKVVVPGVESMLLEPAPGTVWPTRRLVGGGGAQKKRGGIKSRHNIGGTGGVDLEIDGERATLFIAKKERSGLPLAHGFCLPATGEAASPEGGGMVATNAGASTEAFSAASWSEDDCALITRSGRRGRIDYTIAPTPASVQLATSEARLLDAPRVTVSRVQGSGGDATRFGGKTGPSGRETLFADAKAMAAVQLIEFDRLGTVVAEAAAAICGHSKIVRRPMMK